MAAGMLAEGLGEVTLAGAARAGDEHVLVGADPVVLGKLQQLGLLQAAGRAVVDVSIGIQH